MTAAFFPLTFPSDDVRLLTGLVIGFFFGFVLERAGFGNARKLAGQFYLTDMTVFKVMFTAILVAMIGFFGLQSLGLVDASLVWINPTFLPSQAVGGFLLGVGFVMSGLCPGTSVVSMMSGRIDAWVTFAGIFVGIAFFAVAADVVPGVETLYHMGSGEVSQLHRLLGAPALGLALAVLGVALLAFIGAEKVEAVFARDRAPIELTPPSRPRLKLAVGGSLAVAGGLAVALATPARTPSPFQMASIAPLSLAQSLIERKPGLLILDLRSEPEVAKSIPGAVRSADEAAAAELLRTTPAQTTVVVYDETGTLSEAPASWPGTLQYRFLEGGFKGWQDQVLTPAEATTPFLKDREWILMQNQISAFFSGAAVQSAPVAAPPPAMGAGAAPKKKAGGC